MQEWLTDRGMTTCASRKSPPTVKTSVGWLDYPYFTLYNQPLKMGPIEGSETSANHYMTLGKYPEEHTQQSNFLFSLSIQLYSLKGMSRLYCLKNSVQLKFITEGTRKDVELRGKQSENQSVKPHKTKKNN
jgi:hypothetical protein